jgi:hypothetical protein
MHSARRPRYHLFEASYQPAFWNWANTFTEARIPLKRQISWFVLIAHSVVDSGEVSPSQANVRIERSVARVQLAVRHSQWRETSLIVEPVLTTSMLSSLPSFER